MSLKDRLAQLVSMVDNASETEFPVLIELMEEKCMVQEPCNPKAKKPVAKPKRKLAKYSKAQIVKAFELKKRGFTQKEIGVKTGIKEGTLRNPNWLKDSYKRVNKK